MAQCQSCVVRCLYDSESFFIVHDMRAEGNASAVGLLLPGNCEKGDYFVILQSGDISPAGWWQLPHK